MHDPQRFAKRKEPKLTGPLGEPTSFLDELEQLAWVSFQREIPWLLETDRALIEAACRMRARLWGGMVDVKIVTALSSILSKLGATPADRTKVFVPDDPDENPEDKFFN
jgi:hypothetical protein